MAKPRKFTLALVLQCQAEYETARGAVLMQDIAAMHGVSARRLREARRRFGLPECDGPRGPRPGSNCGGGVVQFRPDHDALARWNRVIWPGWRVHGEVRG